MILSQKIPDLTLSSNIELSEVLTRLSTYYPKAIDPGLGRTLALAARAGNPHLNLPPVIHVAGTNGKGSSVAFLRSLFKAAGCVPHVMTSPHLVRFNERLVVADREIDDQNLLQVLLETENLNAGAPITFFEITTVAGFIAFARQKADICILETGMGGRLDSTNIVPAPAATLITMISYDHKQFLGSTLPLIAGEKAGIIKPHVPCVIGEQTEEALKDGVMQVFEARAAEVNAPLYRFGQEWGYKITKDGFVLEFGGEKIDLPRPNLLGDHQISNAAAAIVAAKIAASNVAAKIKADFSQETLKKGLSQTVWPARLQQILKGPLVDLIAKNSQSDRELWLDGGHNDGGGMVLARQIQKWRQDAPEKPVHLILGMLSTKEPEEFFVHLRGLVASATAISIPHQKQAFSAETLAQKLGIETAENAGAALLRVMQKDRRPCRILIAGSLYLAGEILRENG